jgi:hypothetical protein
MVELVLDKLPHRNAVPVQYIQSPTKDQKRDEPGCAAKCAATWDSAEYRTCMLCGYQGSYHSTCACAHEREGVQPSLYPM